MLDWMSKIIGTGRICRVTSKYAYIQADDVSHGSVFVNPASVESDISESSSQDLTRLLPLNAVVKFVAIPQEPKNGCIWRSTCVRLLSSVEESMPDVSNVHPFSELVSDRIGVVNKIFPTYAFILSEDLGMVFFPGSALSSCSAAVSDVVDLTAHLQVNDSVIFSAQQQYPSNGCRWRAVTASKLEADVSEKPEPIVATQDAAPQTETFSSKTVPNSFQEGIVTTVSVQYAFVASEDVNTTVFVNAASLSDVLTGGDRVTSLEDLLKPDEFVRFIAVPQAEKNGCKWRAESLTKLSATDLLLPKEYRLNKPIAQDKCIQASVCEQSSETQTLVRIEDLVWRAIRDDRELFARFKEKYPALAKYSQRADS